MAKIVFKDRQQGGYQYTCCPKCNEIIEIKHPLQLAMPYYGKCGMVVLDCSQLYCCWCGSKFEENHIQDNTPINRQPFNACCP